MTKKLKKKNSCYRCQRKYLTIPQANTANRNKQIKVYSLNLTEIGSDIIGHNTTCFFNKQRKNREKI